MALSGRDARVRRQLDGPLRLVGEGLDFERQAGVQMALHLSQDGQLRGHCLGDL